MAALTRILVSVLLVAFSGTAIATEFNVMALFPGKAMIESDGKRFVLKAGEEKKGFLLISTNTYEQTAIIEIDGKTETYSIGRQIGGTYAKPSVNEVRINSGRNGHFQTRGQINGKNVNFLLDTGATAVSMNENLARSLRIDFAKEGKKIRTNTAAGPRDAYRVMLDEVSVGGITLYNVAGTVLKGSSPEITLLGMSFLGQLQLQQSENLMVLRKKF